MFVVLVVWFVATLIGAISYAAVRVQDNREDVRRAIDRCFIASLLGTGLMIELIVGTLTGTLHTVVAHTRGVDLAIMFTAWAGLLIGPAAIFDSVRIRSPFRDGVVANSVRGLLTASWGLAAYATVMDAVYT
jgi:hypothetical protein